MSIITVIGGTGYAGAAIVEEALRRGHEVKVVSRSAPAERVSGVTYIEGSALDASVRGEAFDLADAVVSATSPRGDMATQQVGLIADLAEDAARTGVPLIVVGGFSSLRPAPGAPRFIEGEVAEQYRAEALAGHSSLEVLMGTPDDVDYVFVSPAGKFGSWVPGERTGSYRLGGEVALFDADGNSSISGADFAVAILDIIEDGSHHREHLSVAY